MTTAESQASVVMEKNEKVAHHQSSSRAMMATAAE
jgi:hypothetical protein